MTAELDSCPFCGGSARFTARRIRGSRRFSYEFNCVVARWRVRVICNKCHTMGSPETTELVRTYKHIEYGQNGRGRWIDDKAVPAFEKAAEKWNRRSNNDS